MKRLFAILTCGFAVLCSGCSEEKDILPEQRKKIVSYLEGSHIPRLTAQDAVDPDSQSPFYTVSGSSVYRYIANFYDPGRDNRTEVRADSKVTITFRIYVFDYSNIPDSELPLYTNDETLREDYEKLGLTVEGGVWTFEPLVVDMRGGILNGLRLALLGCREGDQVEAYMTYNMAYGDKIFGTIPRESPIALKIDVGAVE